MVPPRLVAALAAVLAGACARTLPPDRSQAAVYRDLQRIVTVTEARGWEIDRSEVEGALPQALLSVCAVDERARQDLLTWLDARIGDLGGPVEAAWRARGRDLGRVGELLELTRVRLLLVAARDAAARDCPFWIEPAPRFVGRQIPDDRWHLSLGGGGKGIVSLTRARDFSGGGAGRLLVGRTFGSRIALRTGVEVGTNAVFERNADGARSAVTLAFDAVAPVIVRWWRVNSYYEVETGPLLRFTERDLAPDPGVRVIGVAVGALALRERWFFPGFAFAVTWDAAFPEEGEPIHVLKLGARVSFDIEL